MNEPAIRLSFRLGRGFISRAIAWWGCAPGLWSHVAAQLPNGKLLDARSDVLGGVPVGVQIRDPETEPVKRSALVEIPGNYGAWRRFLESQIGREYDVADIWGDIIGRRLHDPGRWICSALQTQALKAAGSLKDLPIEDSQVTPDSLYLIVMSGLGGRILVKENL